MAEAGSVTVGVDVDVDVHVKQRGPRSATIDLTDGPTLQREVACAVLSVHKSLLNDTEVAVSDTLNFIKNELVVRLEKFLYVNPLGKLVVEYPATPWEHFRARYFPAWALRRKPVRMHTVVRSAAVAFPEAAMVFPTSMGKPVFITREAPFRGEDGEVSPDGPEFDPEYDLPAYN